MYIYINVHVYVFAYTHIQYMYIHINIYTYVEVSNHSEVPTRQPPGKPFKSSLSCWKKRDAAKLKKSEVFKTGAFWKTSTALNPSRSPHHSNHLYNKNKNPSQKSSKRKKKIDPTHQSNFMIIFWGYQQSPHRNQTNRNPHRFHRGLGTIDFQLHQRGTDHTTNLADGSEEETPKRNMMVC